MPYFTPAPTAANTLALAAQIGARGNLAAAMRILNANGLTVADMQNYLISTNGLHGLGAVPPIIKRVPRLPFAPMHGLGAASPAAPVVADPDIAAQLQSVRFDWATGNMYVGTNKYSILTTILGGIVVKGVLWGTNKVGAGARALVGRKKAATNPRRRR